MYSRPMSSCYSLTGYSKKNTSLNLKCFNTLSAKPHKMVKHTQTIRRQQPTNCLSVFDHFVGLALKNASLQIS